MKPLFLSLVLSLLAFASPAIADIVDTFFTPEIIAALQSDHGASVIPVPAGLPIIRKGPAGKFDPAPLVSFLDALRASPQLISPSAYAALRAILLDPKNFDPSDPSDWPPLLSPYDFAVSFSSPDAHPGYILLGPVSVRIVWNDQARLAMLSDSGIHALKAWKKQTLEPFPAQ